MKVLGVDVISILLSLLYVSLAIILFYLGYKKLLKYIGKGETYETTEKYCFVETIERDPAYGELEFFFECEEEKELTFEILNHKLESIVILAQEKFKEGSHILKFDSTTLTNGFYHYQLKTENQVIRKQMNIKN